MSSQSFTGRSGQQRFKFRQRHGPGKYIPLHDVAARPAVSYTHLSAHGQHGLLDKLTTGQIDAALVRTPFPEESFDCRYLTEEPMLAVGRADFFPADCGPKLPLKDLAALPLIIYRRWESVLGRMFPHPQPEYLCVNDDARTSLMWAASGVGVAVVPASIVNGGQSTPFPLTAKIISSPPCLLYTSRCV